jgi:predicted HNH restriction endonuclease
MRKDSRTYADRRDYIIKAVAKRRRTLKNKAIAYMGGQCKVCGYNKYPGALDLHHIDPSLKSFEIGYKGYTRSWETVRAELDKCVLVCANCHREIEAGIISI